ncbi:MAG: hypothetical protein ABIH87_03620 [bacterium]
MKNLVIGIIIVIVGGANFYAGMIYKGNGQAKTGQAQTSNNQNFRNMSPEQRQDMMQARGGATGMGQGARVGQGGEMLAGEIMSKDDASITIKLSDGGSKIAYIASSTTQISKTTEINYSDLEVGQSVVVGATKNDDGTYTASSIRLGQIIFNTSTNKQ